MKKTFIHGGAGIKVWLILNLRQIPEAGPLSRIDEPRGGFGR